MDEEDEKHTCPICWESYTNPKLLECRHTFCASCLEKFLKPRETSLKCPLCRSDIPIPENGIAGFMNNFFVPNKVKKMIIEQTKCDMCCQDNCSTIKICPHCKQAMCLSCSVSHKKALVLSGVNTPNTESDSENNTDDEDDRQQLRYSYDAPVPSHLAASLDFIRYKKVVGMVSSFSLESFRDEDGDTYINCICPISATECWVVPFHGPQIIRCDISGNIKMKITPIHYDNISNIEYRNDGSLLIAMMYSSEILKYFTDKITKFASTSDLLPLCLSSFPDGRIAVVGVLKKKKERDENYGQLQILSSDGTVLDNFGGKYAPKLFKHPLSVSVNKNSFIFVCDRDRNRVLVLSDKGEILNQYLGGQRSDLMRQFVFYPICSCIDSNGNVVVNDLSINTLHLLDSNGNFIGLVLANQPELFGHPIAVAIDPEDKIWTGDIHDRKVRIYKCKAFVNQFEERPNPPTLPLFNLLALGF